MLSSSFRDAKSCERFIAYGNVLLQLGHLLCVQLRRRPAIPQIIQDVHTLLEVGSCGLPILNLDRGSESARRG
jgi:hypothetical protein